MNVFEVTLHIFDLSGLALYSASLQWTDKYFKETIVLWKNVELFIISECISWYNLHPKPEVLLSTLN